MARGRRARRPPFRAGALPAAVVLLATLDAGAQPEAGATPPRLVRAEEALWPFDVSPDAGEVVVPCRVTLDDTGAVTGVEVLQPQGRGFDEAAVEAIQASVFEPARHADGTPLPAQFRYRYVFTPPTPEEWAALTAAPVELSSTTSVPAETPEGPVELSSTTSAPAETPEGPIEPVPPEAVPVDFGEPVVTFDGEVLSADEEFPIEGAAVSVSGGMLSEAVVAVADSDGYFSVTDLPPGDYQVRVSAPMFGTLEAEETVVEGEVTSVTYRLEKEATAFETVVRAQRPPREVVRRTIETREIAMMPGSGGDALRAITNLPGIARPPGESGLVVIRGSAPQDTAYFLDGVSIPLIYHFGGFRSAIAPDLLDRIDFYPGNFSVRYPGVLGGIIDVAVRTPNRETWTGYLDMNFIDIGLKAEGPLAENASIAGGVRRSYIDAVLGAVIPPESGISVTAAPVYWDYQLLADWEPSDIDRLRFFVYGSDDSLAVLFEQPDQGDPTVTGETTLGLGFHRFTAEWIREWAPESENQLVLSVGYNQIEFGLGRVFDITYQFVPIQIRDEFSWKPREEFTLTLGVDTTVVWQLAQARLPNFMSGSENASICTLDVLEVDSDSWGWAPGFYLETELRPVEGLRIIPGVRVDVYDDGARTAVDPRLNLRYTVLEGTTLKGGVGLYSQSPGPQETSTDTGNPNLRLQQALQYGLGVEQVIWENIDVSVDFFYKSLDGLVRNTEDEYVVDGRTVAERYDNDAEGRVYGAEILLRYHPDEWFFGWLAVTVLRSEQREPGVDWHPSRFDQRLNLTLVGSLDLGKGWTIGLRFRAAQGYPHTPVVGSVYNADCDTYEAIPGTDGSERLPWFHQLDLRVDKTFDWDLFRLSLYLDVQNVYYNANVEAIGYNYDYTQRTEVTGLPILPSLGLKGEF